MMSATPLQPTVADAPIAIAAFETPSEAEAARQVEAARAKMEQIEHAFHQLIDPEIDDYGHKPLVLKLQGNLVVMGTFEKDTVKVQEIPPRYNQQGKLVKAAEYFVEVTWVESRMSHRRTWHVPRGDVPTHTVFFYGLDKDDHFELVPSVQSVTRIFADGGHGSDTLVGGPQADFLDGGYYLESDDLTGNQGHDILAGGPGDDVMFGEEDNDLLWGEAGKDSMAGGTGHDDLFGGEDNDTMYGDMGNDDLFGGTGKDRLVGEMGNDYLHGGRDGIKDNLAGGTDADQFVVEGTVKKNKDKPQDFQAKEGDKYVNNSGEVQSIVSLNASSLNLVPSIPSGGLATNLGSSIAAARSAGDRNIQSHDAVFALDSELRIVDASTRGNRAADPARLDEPSWDLAFDTWNALEPALA
jgi:hypothetical protein